MFAHYLSEEICGGQVGYRPALIVSIIITAIMSNLGFSGIMTLAMPIVFAIYPALIVLSLVNIAHVLYGFKWVKIPVFATLIITLVVQHGTSLLALLK